MFQWRADFGKGKPLTSALRAIDTKHPITHAVRGDEGASMPMPNVKRIRMQYAATASLPTSHKKVACESDAKPPCHMAVSRLPY